MHVAFPTWIEIFPKHIENLLDLIENFEKIMNEEKIFFHFKFSSQ